jgi:hypothetical protein
MACLSELRRKRTTNNASAPIFGKVSRESMNERKSYLKNGNRARQTKKISKNITFCNYRNFFAKRIEFA